MDFKVYVKHVMTKKQNKKTIQYKEEDRSIKDLYYVLDMGKGAND